MPARCLAVISNAVSEEHGGGDHELGDHREGNVLHLREGLQDAGRQAGDQHQREQRCQKQQTRGEQVRHELKREVGVHGPP